MPEILTKPTPEHRKQVDSYQLTPYGLLLIKLGSDALARAACDTLELHMRKFNCVLIVDDARIKFVSAE